MQRQLFTDPAPARYWHRLDDGRLQCDLCPRFCKLHDGSRGLCFVRGRDGDALVLDTWGRSSGFCIDPIEKKPLNHWLPGTPVLSFGTAGCNLACKFCQNWDISKSRDTDRLAAQATPAMIAAAAADSGCRSVAYTYNDPVIFLEYAVEVAAACRARGIASVAVTAGYVCAGPRAEFFAAMDAANVDLKAFTEDFYHRVCGGHLAPVLETLVYLKRETRVWFELTTLLIPATTTAMTEIARLAEWVGRDSRTRSAAALHGLSPGLEAHRRPADAAGDAEPRTPSRPRGRAPVRLYRQCPRPRRCQHLVPGLRREADRSRRPLPHRRLAARCARAAAPAGMRCRGASRPGRDWGPQRLPLRLSAS